MAKEMMSMTVNDMLNLKAAALSEKQVASLNGADTCLYTGARLLCLSDQIRQRQRSYMGAKYWQQVLPALNLSTGEPVLIARTALAGGMGYTTMPKPGEWKLTEDGKWHILHPMEDDPARESLKTWGVKYLHHSTLVDKKGGIPRCFLLEVTNTGYVHGRGPVNVEASPEEKAKDLQDLSFHPFSQRFWEGTFKFLRSEEEVRALLREYNGLSSRPIDLEEYPDLFKI